MKRKLLALLISGFTLMAIPSMSSETTPDSTAAAADTTQMAIDSVLIQKFAIEQSLKYQTGTINLGVSTLKVPAGYKFLDAKQSNQVLTELWGNPPSEGTLGLLFPEDISPLSDNFSYAIEISYSEEGHIDDEDAEDIDYDELLTEMKEDMKAASEERVKSGYDKIELIGWADKPYYDAENKKLHWAKEVKFGDAEVNTLNYNIRVLGRKGVMVLNIISDIDQLAKVKPQISTILASVEFNAGNKYSDFNPDIDEVAAYGIGGLIAGKVLAKVGFFALLLKFWKVLVFAVIAGFAAIKKFLFGKKEESEPAQQKPAEEPAPAAPDDQTV
jgi:uncharacterized membrane-anchored protein